MSASLIHIGGPATTQMAKQGHRKVRNPPSDAGARMNVDRELFREPPTAPPAPDRSVINTFGSKATRQEFFLPVSGFVWFFPEEMKIIDHPAFQRLSKVYQLGQAHLVYRGATHKRLEHVLGVVGIAQRMISAVATTAEKGRIEDGAAYAAKLSVAEQRFIRLGALLHDIGHLAAGHTLEDELEIIGKHDGDKRITLIFDRIVWDGVECMSLRETIDEAYNAYVPEQLKSYKLTASELTRLLIRKRPPPEIDEYKEYQDIIDYSCEIRHHICSNMIGNTICADLLDYIYRDWYHIGKLRSFDDRIFQYMELRRQHDGREPVQQDDFEADVSPSHDDRFVISLGRETKVRTDGVSAILSLLEWRYELAEAVLFHRTKVAAGAMLDRALYELWKDKQEDELIEQILTLSDDQLLDVARRQESVNAVAAKLLDKLRHRKIYSVLATHDVWKLNAAEREFVEDFYAGPTREGPSAAQNRAITARYLEADFELPEGSIAIYCSRVKAKLADVTVAIDDHILPFQEYEEDDRNQNRLSGGHLKAQINRFQNLMKFHVFLDGEIVLQMQSESDSELDRLRSAIERIVLGRKKGNAMLQEVQGFAKARCHDEKARGG